MSMIDLIKQRRSIRAFTPHMPPRELILECLEAASWAPNPSGNTPKRRILMKDLQKDEMIGVLKNTPDGVLALSDSGQPYCIPFGFVYVRGEVYLSMFATGRKWGILQENPKACFNVFCWNDDHTEWRSVVIDGDIEQVLDLDAIEAVVKANIEKNGLDPVEYLPKRMEYYKKNLDNPKALKTFRIKTRSMGGKKMHTLLGQ